VAELGPNARAVKGSVLDEADLDRLCAAVKAKREKTFMTASKVAVDGGLAQL
jgi:hypothetical protein